MVYSIDWNDNFILNTKTNSTLTSWDITNQEFHVVKKTYMVDPNYLQWKLYSRSYYNIDKFKNT